MPDAPLAPFGTPMELRDPSTGRYVTRPAFYPPSDERHTTTLAAYIKDRTLLYYYGPDETRDGTHIAATQVGAYDTHRIVYFSPHEFVRCEPDGEVAG
jgi:hypothetical protein